MSDQTAAEFDAERQAAAQAQNQGAENAVPESRPTAATTDADLPKVSNLTQHLIDEGEISAPGDAPMGKEAYDRAASPEQKRKAEKASKTEGIMTGNTVTATVGPHEGRIFAVTGIDGFRSVEDELLARSGSPEKLYIQPLAVSATAIGDDRDGERLSLNVDDNGLVKLNESEARRGGRRR